MTQKETINQLVIEEYQKANEKFPMFNSSHEAWAVLKEEVEEFENEAKIVIESNIMCWKAVKHNNIHLQKEVLKVAMERSFDAFEELIQVMAMIHKYEMYLNQFPEEQPF